jgi:hypothetical protein
MDHPLKEYLVKPLTECLGLKRTEELDAIELLTNGDPEKKKKWDLAQTLTQEEMELIEKQRLARSKVSEIKSFKEGIESLNRESYREAVDVPPGASGLTNPDRYQSKVQERVRDAVQKSKADPVPLRFKLVGDASSNVESREFLWMEYAGHCQVTGNTFPKRDGRNYFEALTLVSRLGVDHLNDPGNMICLSAEMAARFQHAEFHFIDSFEEKIHLFKAEANGGTSSMRSIKLLSAGEEMTLTWSERHFLRLLALWKEA